MLTSAVSLPWDANGYQKAVSKKGFATKAELGLMTRFPPIRGLEDVLERERSKLQLPISEGPCVIVDQHGRILVWCLPSVIPKHRQVRVFHLAGEPHELMMTKESIIRLQQDGLMPLCGIESSDSVANSASYAGPNRWRTGPKYYRTGGSYGAGQLFLAVAWYPQGHKVCVI